MPLALTNGILIDGGGGVIPPPSWTYPTDPQIRAAGYIIVDDYGAKPDGSTDSTVGINNAILAGISQFKPVWFHSGGDYMISGPIYAYIWMGTSASGVQMPSLVGASYNASTMTPQRARLRIFDNTTFYNSATNYEPMVVFRQFQDPTNSLTPPAGTSFDPLTTPAGWNENTANNGFGGLYVNIDLHFGSGNVGACGLMATLAQSSHIQHCAVTATGGGFAGFIGLPVEGSTCVDLSVNGGQYGVYGNNLRNLGGYPSYISGVAGSHVTGLTCTNQTVACFATGGFMSSSVCGFNFQPAAGAKTVIFNSAGRAGDGGLFLHDGQVTMSGGGNPLAFDNTQNPQVNFGLHNVYVTGTSNLVKTASNTTVTGSGTWPIIADYHSATSSTTNATSGTSITQSLINGVVTSSQEPFTSILTNNAIPPATLISQHTFSFPQIDNGPYINITSAPYNCTDASTSSGALRQYNALTSLTAIDAYPGITQAMSDAIAAGHGRVFVPRGSFCVSAAPVLGTSTILFGSSIASSQIMPILTWAPTVGNPPVIDTTASTSATTQLINLCVVRPMTRGTVINYNGNSAYSGNRFNGVNWKAGRKSIFAAIYLENDFQSNGTAGFPRQILSITGTGGGRFYSTAYREEDFCNQDTFMIPLQISGTSEPIWVYGCNLEFGDKQYSTGPCPYTNIQIANSANIRIFNSKREGHSPNVVITNSTNVAHYVSGKLGNEVDTSIALSNYPGATYYSQGYVDTASNGILICDWTCFFNRGLAGQKQIVDTQYGATLDYLTQICVYVKGSINDGAMH